MNYCSRNTEYLKYVQDSVISNPFLEESITTFHAVYYEVTKLELKKRGIMSLPFCKENLDRTLYRIANRMDMAEFGIPGLIRILHAYTDMLDPDTVDEITETLINFRYWLDEPGKIYACYFSENHQPLYHSAEYLVGSLFPDRIFPSNMKTGKWHREHGKIFLGRWMKWRKQFGFGEWCTNYYSEDMIALLGISQYAEDVELREQAVTLIHTLLMETALNTFDGHWIGSHGRTYTEYQVEPAFESISAICHLFWNKGDINGHLADCAIMFAVYDFDCPQEVKEAALYSSNAFVNKERMSLNTSEAKFYGVDPANFDNIMFFWGNQTFDAREVIDNSIKVIDPSNWMHERFNAYREKYRLCEQADIRYDPDPDFTALTQVDLYTYKTKDYGLSCAQDYRKGKQGYQQQPWGAYLGGRAKVFTTHPGSVEYNDRPNQIAGNWILPKAVQHENVLLCIYRIPADCTRMLETHAFFPQNEFDEVQEQAGWVFGKKDNAYVALYSLVPAYWKEPDNELYKNVYHGEWREYYDSQKPFFYHANGHANVWVIEMGSEEKDGTFENFIANFTGEDLVSGDTFCVSYKSPSVGMISCGWNEPLIVKGKEIPIHDYPRYDNPLFHKEFIVPCKL